MSKICTLWDWQATTKPLSTPPKHCTVDVNRPRVIEIRDSASITAGVTIGNNVVIGTNTLISKDVPVNRVVVGNPPARREWHRLLPAEASRSAA